MKKLIEELEKLNASNYTNEYSNGYDAGVYDCNQIVCDKIDIISVDYSRNRFVNNNKPNISYILNTPRKVKGSADAFILTRNESKLFPTKADLLNSL